MKWKPRFGMRFLLLAVVVAGAALGLWLKATWAPVYQTITFRGTLNDATTYRAEILFESDRFRGRSARYALVVPDRTSFGKSSAGMPQLPNGPGLELYPNGIFWEKERIAGFGTKRVVVVLGRQDVRVIEVALDDLKDLDEMTDLETSKVWQQKVEPEIDRLVAARENVHDKTYRSQRAARQKAQAKRANAVMKLPED